MTTSPSLPSMYSIRKGTVCFRSYNCKKCSPAMSQMLFLEVQIFRTLMTWFDTHCHIHWHISTCVRICGFNGCVLKRVVTFRYLGLCVCWVQLFERLGRLFPYTFSCICSLLIIINLTLIININIVCCHCRMFESSYSNWNLKLYQLKMLPSILNSGKKWRKVKPHLFLYCFIQYRYCSF